MAMTITVELDDLEEKCMRWIAANPEEFINNLVEARVFAAKQEIYNQEVKRMTADPNVTNIPANIDTVVNDADIEYADVDPDLPEITVADL